MMAAIARRQAQESVIDIGPEATISVGTSTNRCLAAARSTRSAPSDRLPSCKDVVREELDTESSETQFRTALAMRSP
jgi:hypothetical protein